MKQFQREERYIVVKLKDLTSSQRYHLREMLNNWRIPTQESVVIESDWEPEYEMAWNLIEQRCNRND